MNAYCLKDPPQHKHAFALFLTTYVILGSASFGSLYPVVTHDFAVFYTAGKKLLTGQVNALYDSNSYPNGFPFVRPAWQALTFLPFAPLSYRTAYIAWSLVTVALLGLSVWLLRDEIGVMKPQAGLLLALVMAVPICETIIFGQDSTLFLLLVVLAYAALKKNQQVRGGAFLALASFKLNLLLPALVLFGLRTRWRVLAAAATVGFVLFAISTLIAGPGWMERCWAAEVVASTRYTETGTLRQFLVDIGLPRLALPCMLMGVTLVLWTLRRAPLEVAFATVVFASVLLNWHAHIYDYVCLLPAWTSSLSGRGMEKRGQ